MLWIMLILFQVKHFLCDYMFQTMWMAMGKGERVGWIKPLAHHCGIHAAGTGAVCILMGLRGWLPISIMAADFVLHFAVDRVKASKSLGGRWNPSQPQFWQALGADQMAHHVINLAFAYLLTQA